jgi:hypothetical protein
MERLVLPAVLTFDGVESKQSSQIFAKVERKKPDHNITNMYAYNNRSTVPNEYVAFYLHFHNRSGVSMYG